MLDVKKRQDQQIPTLALPATTLGSSQEFPQWAPAPYTPYQRDADPWGLSQACVPRAEPCHSPVLAASQPGLTPAKLIAKTAAPEQKATSRAPWKSQFPEH